MKHPMKLARKEFPRYGAKLHSSNRYHQLWETPWGWRWEITPSTSLGRVRERIAELSSRMNPMAEFVPAPAPPFGEKVLTDHFVERLELMHSQGGVTPEDVRLACLEPTETRYCASSGAYAYMRGDIAVIAAPLGDKTQLRTLWWTRPDLWAKNPRPESKARAHAS